MNTPKKWHRNETYENYLKRLYSKSHKNIMREEYDWEDKIDNIVDCIVLNAMKLSLVAFIIWIFLNRSARRQAYPFQARLQECHQ